MTSAAPPAPVPPRRGAPERSGGRWRYAAAGLLLAAAAAADEAVVVLPAALAARVGGVAAGDRTVQLEAAPEGVRVTVSQALRAPAAVPAYPLAGAEACGDPEALVTAPGFRVPADLARRLGGARSAFDVAVEVVAWVSRRVALDEGGAGAQDAAAVLARGRGRCSGRSNLAVGLLRVLGLPARPVHGVLLGDAGPRWHRWGEVWLGELGWRPFDPGASVGAVSVRYLPMSGAADGAALAGAVLTRLDQRGFAALPRRYGLRVLPPGGVTLRCLARGELQVTLEGAGGARWVRAGAGEVVFEGMIPGAYRLQWRGPGGSGRASVRLQGNQMRVDLGEER